MKGAITGRSLLVHGDGRKVDIVEQEGGLTQTVISNGKRTTRKDTWVPMSQCAGGNVRLERMALIEKYEALGFEVDGADDAPVGDPPVGAADSLYYATASKEMAKRIKDFVTRPEKIPGLTRGSRPEGFFLEESSRQHRLDVSDHRLIIPSNASRPIVVWADAGSAMAGVILALCLEGLMEATNEQKGVPDWTIKVGEAKLKLKTSQGLEREALEALGAIEPKTRDFMAAIGGNQRRALVL